MDEHHKIGLILALIVVLVISLVGFVYLQELTSNQNPDLPTPTPTPTPVPSSTPTPVPTPVIDIGPQSGLFKSPWPPIIYIGVLSLCAMMVLFLASMITQLTNKGNQEVCSEGIGMLRTGIFLIFIVSVILIMALGRGIENNGAISILSAIIGYVFGRGTLGVGGQRTGS